MSLIKQSCRGNSRSMDITVSAADLAAIQALMVGKISVYDEKASGGTDVPTPATLRNVKLGVNRKLDRLSCTVNIKHMTATKHITDLYADKALFDADFQSSLTATGLRAIYVGAK